MAGTEKETTTDVEKEKEVVTNTEHKEEPKEQHKSVDVEKVKGDAVSEFLKSLGVEDSDTLKGIVSKAKEEEEKNKTELEKSNDTLTATTKRLAEEHEARVIAEAKLSAISLGAKPELVEELVIIAKSKMTKDKDINEVIAEIKDSTNGKVFFVDESEEKEEKKTVTRKRVTKEEEKKEQKKDTDTDVKEEHKGTMAERLLAGRKKVKSHYYSN